MSKMKFTPADELIDDVSHQKRSSSKSSYARGTWCAPGGETLTDMQVRER